MRFRKNHIVFCLLSIMLPLFAHAQQSKEDFTWHYYGDESDCVHINELIQLFYNQAFTVFYEGTPVDRPAGDTGKSALDKRYIHTKCLPACECSFTEGAQGHLLDIELVRSTNPLDIAHHFSPAVEEMSKCLGIDWENHSTDADALRMRSRGSKRTYFNEYTFVYLNNAKLLLKYPTIKVVAFMENATQEYVVDIQLMGN